MENTNNKKMIFAFSTVPYIMVLGNSMLIPEFPQIKAALDLTQFQVGLFITVFSISAALTIPILGYICDKIGRLNVIIPSLIIYGLGGIICGLAAVFFDSPYKIILMGRAIQGIGAAGTAPIVMALVGDIFQSKKRSEVLGIIESANGIGKVTSPLLGALVGMISWTALFFFYAFLALPIATAVYFWGKEDKTKNKSSGGNYFKNVKKVIEEKGFSLISAILAGMLVLFLLFGFLSFFSDLLETKYKVKGLARGGVIAIPILFMSITSYFNGVVLKKKNKYFKYTVIIGITFAAVSLFLLNFITSLIPYVAVFTLSGIGAGLVLPAVNTLVTSSTKSEQRGIITALYGSSRFTGVALGPPTFSALEQINLNVMYLGSSLIAFIVLIIVIFFLKEEKMKPKKEG